MNKHRSSLRSAAGLAAACAVLAFPGIRSAAADARQPDAFPNFENYIKISGQAPWISGDGAAYQSRAGTSSTGSGGIEDMHFSRDLSDVSTLTFDGHALAGSDDYLADLKVDKINVGTLETGYKRFRTFYDGVGGFFPLNDTFQRLGVERLHVDRGAFFANFKLARPDCPVFTLTFRDEVRTGQKDSSEWAPIVNPVAVVVNGALVGTTPPVNTPYIYPNVQSIDEHHLILEGGMEAKVGKVSETLKVTMDHINNDDSRDYVKYAGSNVIVDPTVVVHDDQETRRATTYRVLSQTEAALNDQLALEVGLSYSSLSSTNGGNWISPTYNTTAKAVFPSVLAGNIYGGSRADDYVGNLFLRYTSKDKNWQAELGYRDELNLITSSGGFYLTSLASGSTTISAANTTTSNDVTYSHYKDRVATPELSVEYLGVRDVVLYAGISNRITRGDQNWINPYAASTVTGAGVVTTSATPPGSVFYQDANQAYEDAKVGVNWNASTRLTVRAEVYRKDHRNKFIGSDQYIGIASTGALYTTGYTLTGMKFSVVVKPVPELSFSTRYLPSSGRMAIVSNAVTGGVGTESPSAKMSTQSISETVDWTPSPQVYLQGSVNVVYNYIQTSYPIVVVSTTTSVPVPFVNADNNYVTGSALCGFVLDKATDAQVQLTWQQATNYNPQVALGGQAFGSGYLQESVTGGLKHKFTDRIIGEGKIGYLRQTNATTGGFTDYKGPLAYASVTFAF